MVLLFGLLFGHPLISGSLVNSIFLGVMLLSALMVSNDEPRVRRIVIISAIPAVVLVVCDIFFDDLVRSLIHRPVWPVLGALTVVFLGYSGWLVLRSLLKTQEVTLNEVVGTINFYLIIGFVWAYMYMLTEFVSPGSFNINPAEGESGGSLLYFSFVTLTTLGYGDITPQKPFAQMLTAGEAVIGQLYVAIVVTYLLSVYIARDTGDKTK
jgi:hypothetical protein